MRMGNFTLLSDSADSCVETVSAAPELLICSAKMVRIAGLEPARVAPLPPQSSVSANSTICAHGCPLMNQRRTSCARRNWPTKMDCSAERGMELSAEPNERIQVCVSHLRPAHHRKTHQSMDHLVQRTV